jgi:hypothetical protein
VGRARVRLAIAAAKAAHMTLSCAVARVSSQPRWYLVGVAHRKAVHRGIILLYRRWWRHRWRAFKPCTS